MKKTVITLIDDLNPNAEIEAAETVSFALDGTTYEIDLSAENAHVLRARLKEFIQAGRVVKGTSRRAARPLTEPASGGATLSRTQSGTDPADISAWAVEKGLREPGKAGRLSNTIKEAYAASRAGDDGPLNELRALIRAVKPASEPAKQLDHSRAHAAVAPAEAKQDTDPTEDAQPEPADPKEAEARRHYRPVTRHPRIAEEKKWKRRTGYGCERTMKIEEMTLVERIEALSDANLAILRMLAGIDPLKNGKVSRLSGSDVRLENLEVIEYTPENEHGWVITDFGKYALEVRSMG